MEHSYKANAFDEHASDDDETSVQPFNAEAEDVNEDLESAIKGDAIGNTLYSKSWLLKFFLNLASNRSVEVLEHFFENNENHKIEEHLDPDNILSNFDSLVAMSAEETVAEFLIDATSGCFGMLIAEMLPIQINDEHKFFVPIRSHFWRRQELCLVTLSNIVVHRNVLKKMIIDISSSGDSSNNDEHILIQVIQLSFSCVLFGENFGVEAQFTSVLVACFQFLRNLTYSLNLLICEHDLSDQGSATDDNNEMISREIENSNSTVPILKMNQSEMDSGEIGADEVNKETASKQYEQERKIESTLKFIADKILFIVSKPEVVQHFGMILASSCNEDLLNKMSRLLTVLLELSSDLEYEDLVHAYGQLTFLYCTKEALKQTFKGFSDMKTSFVFIDFIGEILNQLCIDGDEIKNIFLDANGQKDEQFPIELCDLLADITDESDDLTHCAIIMKVFRVLWQPCISSQHTQSFKNVGKLLMNIKREIGDWSVLDLHDQVAYRNTIEGLSKFIQNYEICEERTEKSQNNELCITNLVQQEISSYRKFHEKEQCN